MHLLPLAFLLATQASASPQARIENVGRDAAQCMAFYQAVEKYVARTEQERQVTKEMQGFMLVLGKESGISVDAFEQIRSSQEHELESRVRANDRVYLDGEQDRCGTFAKRQAEELRAKNRAGGEQFVQADAASRRGLTQAFYRAGGRS